MEHVASLRVSLLTQPVHLPTVHHRYITNPRLLAEFFEMDDLYILCTKPPACVLFRQENSKFLAFEDLEATIVPVFPTERSISIKGFSVRRRQVPICPAFGLTDYKVLGLTLPTALLDLKNDSSIRGHLRFRPHGGLVAEMERLRALEQNTMAVWAGQ